MFEDTEEDITKFYKTLNHDINLKKMENGLWDLDFNNDDYVKVDGRNSLYVACIIALLTGYNEIGDRYENPTYSKFGNRAYELLKTNTNSQLQNFKLKSYFTDCLENIRRVKKVLTLQVSQNISYGYEVYFNVMGLSDETVNGTISLTETSDKINTQCRIRNNENEIIIIQNKSDIEIEALLKDSRNIGISKELLNFTTSRDTKTVLTNNSGTAYLTYEVKDNLSKDYVYVEYKGSKNFNSCMSNLLNIIYIFYSLKIVNGELIYTYDDNYYHPNFKLNSDGELIMTYDPEKLNLNKAYVNSKGNLILEINE